MSTPPPPEPGQPVLPPSAGRRILAVVLAVIGFLAIVLGLLYIFAGTSLPAVVEGSSHHGHHAVRATVSFVIAAVCFVAAWLLSRRRPSAGGG